MEECVWVRRVIQYRYDCIMTVPIRIFLVSLPQLILFMCPEVMVISGQNVLDTRTSLRLQYVSLSVHQPPVLNNRTRNSKHPMLIQQRIHASVFIHLMRLSRLSRFSDSLFSRCGAGCEWSLLLFDLPDRSTDNKDRTKSENTRLLSNNSPGQSSGIHQQIRSLFQQSAGKD